ncbi:hypothetical protein [Megamonas hypermegale]|uniref:hypothetical protein n=1 Tax=Megamonas hypermegale TaxID=158847 RepID=UPI0026EE6CF8|nr:hypothetical protein [Megamonas hypermegale]
MDITNQIKLMSYDRLIDELHALHEMYLDFSNHTDNIMASSCFHIVAKDLETLLNKYDDNKKSLCNKQEAQ